MAVCKTFVLCIMFVVFGSLFFGFAADVYAADSCCYAVQYNSTAAPACCTAAPTVPCCNSSGSACCSLRVLSSIHSSFYIGSKMLGTPYCSGLNPQNVFGSIFKPPRG